VASTSSTVNQHSQISISNDYEQKHCPSSSDQEVFSLETIQTFCRNATSWQKEINAAIKWKRSRETFYLNKDSLKHKMRNEQRKQQKRGNNNIHHYQFKR